MKFFDSGEVNECIGTDLQLFETDDVLQKNETTVNTH